ncbi:zinc knuckle CX2CX4HX4C containing protein [Tanacetum coccineum]|uniref:Zinc knuckle CX2CX4HX4C containing protein n=1 Tax=Tanacetum coccineum TaxID=301880 RepID=A0ABQ5EB07_9ASTR
MTSGKIQKDIARACADEIINAIRVELGDDLLAILVDESGKLKLSHTRIRGQGHDGASNMSGAFNGLRTLIQNDTPSAYFVHCDIESGKGMNQEYGVKRPCYTRWGSHYGSLLNIKKIYSLIYKVLQDLGIDSSNQDNRAEALRVLRKIKTFKFVFCLHLMVDILGETDGLNKTLQKKDQQIVNAMHQVRTSKERLQDMRNGGWEPLMQKAALFCDKYDCELIDMNGAYFNGINLDVVSSCLVYSGFMEKFSNKTGEVGERVHRMKGPGIGNAGVTQPRMPARVLRDPNLVSDYNLIETVAATMDYSIKPYSHVMGSSLNSSHGKYGDVFPMETQPSRVMEYPSLNSFYQSTTMARNISCEGPSFIPIASDKINIAEFFCVPFKTMADFENLTRDIEMGSPNDPSIKSLDIITKPTSYVGAAGENAKDQAKVNLNFCPLVPGPMFNGVNISIPHKVVEKFESWAGLEDVLDGGPWLIHKSLIILKKWSTDTRLLKEELTRILIWVKVHDVPLQVFEEDGISLIANFIGKPVMLDSYTCSMCKDLWGGSKTIHVEYEWRPPRCAVCKIFGHVHDLFPKKVVNPNVVTLNVVKTFDVPTLTVEKTNYGFQTLGKKKKKKVRYEPKASTSAPKKIVTNVDNASNSSSLLKNTVTSSNHDNIASSNSFSSLNVEDDEEEEEVENVYDEMANLFNLQTGGRSSFTTGVG